MFKRYDLDVYYSDVHVYSASFSSINHLVKFACGFDSTVCDLHAVDVVMERFLPLDELMNVFKGENYGV